MESLGDRYSVCYKRIENVKDQVVSTSLTMLIIYHITSFRSIGSFTYRGSVSLDF
jgi:hypothetical protein